MVHSKSYLYAGSDYWNQEEICACRYKRGTAHHRQKRQSFDQEGYNRMMNIIHQYEAVTKDNCMSQKVDSIMLDLIIN